MEPKKKFTRPGPKVAAACMVVGIGLIVASLALLVPRQGTVGMVVTLVAVVFTAVNFHFLISATLLTGGDEEEELPAAESPKARLKALQRLYKQKLISEAEYEEKRREILKEL